MTTLDDGVRRLVLDDRLKLRPPTLPSGRGVSRRVGGPRASRHTGSDCAAGSTTRVPHRAGRRDTGRAPSTRAGRSISCIRARSICTKGSTYRVGPARPRRSRRAGRCLRRATSTRRPAPTCRIRVLAIDASEPWADAQLRLGAIEVTSQVTGYQRKDSLHGEVLGTDDLDLPPSRLVTRGFWCTIDPASCAAAGIARARGAGHPPCRRARGDRHPAAVHDLRPMGRRRRVDRLLKRHRPARRSSSTTATPAVPASPSSATTWPTATSPPRSSCIDELRVPRRLPVVRAVAEVRQLERAPRQAGGDRPVAGGDRRRAEALTPRPSRIWVDLGSP